MLDALQDHRLSGSVDPADRAPVAVPHPDPVLLAAERPSCSMGCERVGGKSLDPDKKRPLVAHRHAARPLTAPGETISRTQTPSMAAAMPSR
jgi:hypothetical protein